MIDRLLNNMVDALKDSTVGHTATGKFSRRDFLKSAGAVAGGTLLAACVPEVTSPTKVKIAPTPGASGPDIPKSNEIGFGTYDCSIEGDKNWAEDQKLFREALGSDYVPGMENAAIPFKATYALNGKFIGAETTSADFIALNPMDVIQPDGSKKQTEDQLWFKDIGTKQYKRLGYVDVQFDTGNGVKKTKAWVRTDKNLGLYDPGLVPEATQMISDGDWLMIAVSANTIVMRPPKELLIGRANWGPMSSCIVLNKPTDLLTPTPDSSPTADKVRFSQVIDISLKRSAPVTVEAPKSVASLPERSMAILSPEDAMNGQVRINQGEAQKFYREYWLDFLIGSVQQRELTPDVGGKQSTTLKLVPNTEFISFIKTNFGVDPTQINEGNIDVFLDALKNSKKDPNDPDDPGYWIPAGMPMPYLVDSGYLAEIHPAPSFCAKTILIQLWNQDRYIKQSLAGLKGDGGVKNNEVFGSGIERYRWSQRFVSDSLGNTFLTLLLTGSDPNDPVFGNNPVGPGDVDKMSNNLSLFNTLNKNIMHATVSKSSHYIPTIQTALLSSDQSNIFGYQNDWLSTNAPKYKVFQLAGR